MKNTLKRSGAIGLAAVTVVTGLSFGPAAQAADPVTPAAATVKLVFQDGNQYRAITDRYGNAQTPYPTLAAAQAGALPLRAVKLPNGRFQLTGLTSQGNSCFITGTTGRVNWYSLADSRCDSELAGNQWWYDGANLRNESQGTKTIGEISRVAANQEYLQFSSTNTFPLVSDATALLLLSAKADSVDVSARTAAISGTAVPGSYVVIGTPVPTQVQADATGRWSTTISGLSFGANTIPLEQYENGTKTAESTLDVNLAVTPVTATASFPADRTQPAVLSGGAQPGATVIVTDGAGTELVRTTANTGSGVWSTPITAPGAGGTYNVRVRQEIGGTPAGAETSASIAYGAGVTITTPVQGAAHPGGPVAMTGRGEAGAQITVREQGKQNVIGYGTVFASGDWNITTTTSLDARKHVLEVTQSGKGNNTTVSTVTLNPDDDGVTGPFVLATPTNGSTVIAPTNQVSFTGTGTTGARVEIMNAYNSRVIGTATIDDAGNWITSGSVGFGKHKIRAKVTLNGAVENTYIDITVAASDGVVQPFRMTAPTNGQTLVAPDNQVRFTGVGTTGDTVQIRNTYNGRVIATTTVDEAGAWTTTGGVGFGVQNLTAVVTHAGTPTENPFTITLKSSEGVVKPFTLDAPTNGSTVIAPDNQVTFRGTGTTGDTVQILNVWNDRIVASTTVDAAGNWSKAGYLSFLPYDLKAVVSHPGSAPVTVPFSVTVKRSAGVEGPFAVTTPANGSTVTAPDGRVTFTGTGTTGARVVMTAGNGREVVNTTVNDQGTWTATGLLGFQYYDLTTTYTTPGGTPATGTHSLTVRKSDAVINPFQLITPANGSTVTAPNNTVTFSGTGAAGATVQIINDPSGPFERVVAETTVSNDGTWTVRGQLSYQFYNLSYRHTPGTAGGTPAAGDFSFTLARP